MKAYDHKKIEKKWQREWEKKKLYKVKDKVKGKENFYTLTEFSYPSGNLHIGHWYAFGVTDIIARQKRMAGYNVLFPMGFDAFGLPAENAAIKTGADPKVLTFKQMDAMRKQLRSMGAMFDWDREVITCEPEYYKWTQWMFNQFLKNDLAYRAVTKVNWCSKDKTVLANEQVVDGKCERCGTEVEQRDQEQWMLRITKYADSLIDDLEKLNWPEEIKAAQRNWIGRSKGAEIDFGLKTNQVVNYVILHGFTGSNNTNFIPWLKKELEGKGLKVQAPQLPNTENPTEEEQVKYVLDNCNFDKDTIILSHSLGSVVALKVIDKLNSNILGLVTVGGFAKPDFKDKKRPFEKNFNWDFDFAKIRSKIKFAKVLQAKEDYAISLEQASELAKNLGTTVAICDTKAPHFTGDVEPEILRALTNSVKVFTTRPDTIHGATYIVFAPEHNQVERLLPKLSNQDEVKAYIESTKKKSELDRQQAKVKTGVELKGIMAINPATGKEIPVWIADYVLAGYGTGAIMAVPADDERDGEFAEKFNLPIVKDYPKAGFTDFGKVTTKYKFRDWGISRQRYWGCPIPIVYDPEGRAHPVPDKHLPWLLPTDVDHTPDGTAPLARSKELLKRTEKIFGKGWKPEVETMDTFVDSSWYFYRYLDAKNKKTFAAEKFRDAWMPIDLYMGGAEHTTMHLLYSRFWVKALHDLCLVKENEAYLVRRNRGLILGPDGNKMSKSKGNVIDPDDIVERLGADTVRMYLAFMGPYGVTTNYPWDPNGVAGVRRFLERVWKLQAKVGRGKNTPALHKAIKKINEDIEEYKLNTCISQMMILINEWEKVPAISKEEYKILLRLLAPFAPHMAEEIWRELGEKKSIHLSSWPVYSPELVVEEEIKIAIQVNSKVRGEMLIKKDEGEESIKERALKDPGVQRHIGEGSIKKTIYVKNRLINIIV